MDPKNDEPFDRTPWRRLLGPGIGAPAQNVDRRILAEARRALAPRVARWWLPASLAASVVLAVLIVQWQLADSGAPANVTESDVLSAPAQRKEEPARPVADMPPPLTEMPIQDSRRAPVAEAATALPAAPAPAPVSAHAESSSVTGSFRAKESVARTRSPEEWYAEIEALRAAGHIEEADAALARLKEIYPGWLERHQQLDP